ncbi:hypothetical protein [Bacillus cereus]|uniref:hypothetical protein n=1 Tax=Bacillus cereus TaxID=1396 RepID=UPI000BF41D09|nr:hypothetical protein [Bacillus cereus]PET96733.1 hypothetical protein CN527_20990 [Bacillus cereus]PGU51820.1 hypothetical protein COD72_23015 [Bacillus cereus]
MKEGYVIEIENGFYCKDTAGPTTLSNAEFFENEGDTDFYIDILTQMGIEVIDVSHAMLKKEHLNRRRRNARYGVN